MLGHYRDHPKTPEILRRIGWTLADQAAPDLKAKLCLAITRHAGCDAESAEAPANVALAGLAFIQELEFRATHPGPEGMVGVRDTNTNAVVAAYDFAEKSIAVNGDLTNSGSNFPPESINDAVQLLLTYVGELTSPSV